MPGADKKRRMAYAFRRGVRAMTVTSSTTTVAFFANVFSPIMPIQAFGIFSGVLIPVNFLLVVMIMPSAVIFYEDKMEGKTCCGAFKKNEPTQPEAEANDLTKEKTYELSIVEKFFDERCNTMVFKGRYFIFFCSLAWFIVTCV
jgi:predicted RND superfamily exporter protein